MSDWQKFGSAINQTNDVFWGTVAAKLAAADPTYAIPMQLRKCRLVPKSVIRNSDGSRAA